MAGLRGQEQLVAVKAEGTYGTYASPGASDVIKCKIPDYSPEVAFTPQEVITGIEIDEPAEPGIAKQSFSVETQMIGPGAAGLTAGTAPRWTRLAASCGFAIADNHPTNFTMTPAQLSTVGGVSILRNIGSANLYTGKGCRGSMKMSGKVGQAIMLTFAMRSLWNDPGAAAFPASPSFESVVAPRLLGATFAWGGYAAVLKSFDLDFGVELEDDESGAAADGVAGFEPGKWAPKISMVVRDTTTAERNWIKKMKDGDTAAVSLVIGSAVGNTHTITMPRVSKTSAKPTSDLLAKMQIEGTLHPSVAGLRDFFSHVMT